MVLDPEAILQAIIDRNGDCEGFTTPALCKRCPLGNKRNAKGDRVNCLDYLAIDPSVLTEDELFDKYEQAAAEELLNIQMDNLLSED
jgi:hypothetical protein